jgi:transposase-like protein
LKGIPRGKYTREFREEAVKMVVEEKLSCNEVGRRLSMATSTITNWVKAYKEGKLGDIGKGQKPLTEVEMELARTKKELPYFKWEGYI